MSKIDLALEIAVKAHTGQYDRDGEAYILHPLTVGLMGRTDEERMAGFLHDVIEDSNYTAQDLIDAGIPTSVVNALTLLTHDKSKPYMEYVQNIIDSDNPIALRVKFNDLKHNLLRGENYPDLQKKHGEAMRIIGAAVEKQEKVSLYSPTTSLLAKHKETAIFAGGCFWGVQYYFQKQKGVLCSFAGYTGGKEEFPSYEDVRTHKTGHVEAVLVEFDTDVISFETLCKLFFEIHDTAQIDGQGPDLGSQYLSRVFYTNEEQLDVTNKLIEILREKGYEVNTKVEKARDFWIAEPYHQEYYANTGGSPYCHVREKKF